MQVCRLYVIMQNDVAEQLRNTTNLSRQHPRIRLFPRNSGNALTATLANVHIQSLQNTQNQISWLTMTAPLGLVLRAQHEVETFKEGFGSGLRSEFL